MREAIGSTWIIYLGITFILIYVFFAGFIMNYASAYRAANYVVTQIENCQGRMDDCGNVSMKKITDTIREKYSYITKDRKNVEPCYIQNGDSYVFRVNLPVSFDLPIIGNFNPVNVKAETKSINGVPSKSLAEFSKCS